MSNDIRRGRTKQREKCQKSIETKVNQNLS